MIARRVRVTGRVQGVFFRAWTRNEARSLGVDGWVRNFTDGSVEAHLEGDETQVDELIRRMRHGPPHAEVMDVEVSETAAEDLGCFEVRH
ncbi:MAG TPA: acylphosphatase [Sphingomicrobium sp.]|nr:acylphosphatase [Sphingomicrobium sp.]